VPSRLALLLRQLNPGRLIAAVLLLAAAVQATAPGWSPAEPARGSAFTASTADVALAPARQAEAARAAVPLPPATVAARPLPVPLAAAVLAPQHSPRPDSTGPPAARPPAALPEPRAPPFA